MLDDTSTAPQPFSLGLGGIPLKLEVSITPSDEVQALRARVQSLQHKLDDLQARYNRVEYLYRCETLINAQLVDHCKGNKVDIPKRFFQRPNESVGG